MGTSQTSNGAPSGVPMVPSWVPELPALPPLDPALDPAIETPLATPEELAIPLAPSGRFYGTRLSMGSFASNGDSGSMHRGVGRYISSGYGGANTAVRRFGGTITTAGALFRVLSGGNSGESPTSAAADPALTGGRTAREVLDAVIELVRPVDGTQDAEAGRAAIRDALSELLGRFPDADLMNLNEGQKNFAIERYVALDVFHRLELDLGKTIIDRAPSAVTAFSRLRQIKNYVKETISAAFRKVLVEGRTLTANGVNSIVRAALLTSFEVFQEYAE